MLSTTLETQPFITCALATFGIQFCGYVAAFALQTETFYDILGSGNFLLLGLWTYFSSIFTSTSSLISTKPLICTILFMISRSWLLVFLAWRAHDRKGDTRFDGVKEDPVTFLVYWMVQACWVYSVSLPTIYINTSASKFVNGDGSLTSRDIFWMLSFAFGILIEIIADIQKTKWIKQGRKGGFCNVGVWKLSRHPNYFGEMLQWWSSFLLVPLVDNDIRSWLFCILSPLFTSWVLLLAPGTGLTNAEGDGLSRYYKKQDVGNSYSEYRSKTSILIPMIGYASIPMLFRRVFLFEWKRYEYKPSESQKKE